MKIDCPKPAGPVFLKRIMGRKPKEDSDTKNLPEVTELRGVTEEIDIEFAGEIGRKLTPNSYNKYLVLCVRRG